MSSAQNGWDGRRALVTGAGGFIGSHLAEALVREGASVRAFIRYNSRNDHGALDSLPRETLAGIEVHAGDVRDPESAARAVVGTDVVFHLAAQVAIPYSYVEPRTFFETNVIGTLNIAQACREAEVEHLVHTSTSEIYGTAQEVPMTEHHPVSGQSPYAASKIGADQLVFSFYRSYGLPVTILRPFNTYGPRQSARAVIPTIVTQMLASDTVRLGSLTPRRDLTYVADTVSGFIAAAAARDAIGETVQLGTGNDVSVGELVDEIAALLGRSVAIEHRPERVRPETSEVMATRL